LRNKFAETFYELAKQDERLCMIVADISPAGSMEKFRKEFPDRFINVGVAEQAMVGLAAGMAQRGLRPICYTIATFALFRPYEFVRNDLAYQKLPVTIVGMGAGLSYSTLGGTHQAIEDVEVACAIPGMTVLAPCDPPETASATRWCVERDKGGPVYLRLGKAGESSLTEKVDQLWVFGKVRWLQRPSLDIDPDYCVVSYGPLMDVALGVAAGLRRRGHWVSVVNCHTLSPLDIDGIEEICSCHSTVVTIEEATDAPLGGIVSSIAHGTGCNCPVLSFYIPREFHHVLGTRTELLDYYGLSEEKILAQIT